ncbi:MAG: hypothetical protein AAB783_00705 [Patescibacteria group bacterium]
MTTPELLDFIKKSLASGVTPDQIRNSLISQRWNESDINEAFTQIAGGTLNTPLSAPPPQSEIPPTQTTPSLTITQSSDPSPQSTPYSPDSIPQTSVYQTTQAYTEPPKNRSLIPVIAVVFFLVFGLSAAGGYYYYTQTRLTPEQVLEKAITNASTLKTGKFAGTTHVKFAFDLPEDSAPAGMPQIGPGDYNIKFKGSVNGSDTTKPRVAVAGDGSFSMNFMGLKMSAEGNGEFIFIDNTMYLKLKLPDILKSIGAGFLNDTWIQIEIPTTPGAPANPFTDPREVEKIKTLFSSKKIIREIKELPKENGAYHFALTYDIDEFSKAMTTILNSSATPTKMSQEEERIFTDLFKNLKFTKSEIWIDANTFYTKRILFQIDYNMDLKELVGDEGRLTASLEMDTSYSDFNKPVNIVAPDSSKTIDELTAAAMNKPTNQGNSLLLSRTKANDARRIADSRQIQLALELYADANNGKYPKSLSPLAPKYIPVTPTDPTTNTTYIYSVNDSLASYHLGASLELSNSTALIGDTDCNSKTGVGCDQKLPFDKKTSFDGGDTKGCRGEVGRYCYDITP